MQIEDFDPVNWDPPPECNAAVNLRNPEGVVQESNPSSDGVQKPVSVSYVGLFIDFAQGSFASETDVWNVFLEVVQSEYRGALHATLGSDQGAGSHCRTNGRLEEHFHTEYSR